jgi:hypothetical protein
MSIAPSLFHVVPEAVIAGDTPKMSPVGGKVKYRVSIGSMRDAYGEIA